MKYLILFTLILSFDISFAQRKNLIAAYPFDKEVGSWSEKSMHSPSDVVISGYTKHFGNALRVTLDKGKNDRTELGTSPNDAPREGWFGFSLFFPSDYEHDATPESIVQWQSFPDAGENWRSAPLFLGVMNGSFILDQRTDTAKISKGNTVVFKRDLLGAVVKSKWVSFVVHIKWSLSSDGLIEIWKNDKLIFTKLGPNCYNDRLNPYFKIGIYKWDFTTSKMKSTRRRMYIDEVYLGNSKATYNDVYPGKKLIKTVRYYYDGYKDSTVVR